MVNKLYRKGRVFEYKLIHYLKEFYPEAYVARTAGSHTIVDVILVTQEGTTLYQLKYTKAKPTKPARAKFFKQLEHLPVTALYVWGVPRGETTFFRADGKELKIKI